MIALLCMSSALGSLLASRFPASHEESRPQTFPASVLHKLRGGADSQEGPQITEAEVRTALYKKALRRLRILPDPPFLTHLIA